MNLVESYILANGLGNGLTPVNSLGQRNTNSVLGTGSTLSFLNILQNAQAKDSAAVQNTSTKRISAGTASMDRIFEEAADRYGVDANLLKAIGKAESGFNPSVVSSAGAIGVMQLMPGTARSLGVKDPYNAQQNIMGGAKYISQLLNQYDGNVKLALAAYNAGPGNVAKYGGIPPFKETQNYVNRVLGYAGSQVSAGNRTVALGTDSSKNGANALNGAASDSGQNTSGTIEIQTDTLLTLVKLMRAQMELQWSSMMSSALSGAGTGTSSGLGLGLGTSTGLGFGSSLGSALGSSSAGSNPFSNSNSIFSL